MGMATGFAPQLGKAAGLRRRGMVIGSSLAAFFFEASHLGTVVVSVRTHILTPTLRTHTTLTPHTYT